MFCFIDGKCQNIDRYSELGFRLWNSRPKRNIQAGNQYTWFFSLLYVLSSLTPKILCIDVNIQREWAVWNKMCRECISLLQKLLHRHWHCNAISHVGTHSTRTLVHPQWSSVWGVVVKRLQSQWSPGWLHRARNTFCNQLVFKLVAFTPSYISDFPAIYLCCCSLDNLSSATLSSSVSILSLSASFIDTV